MAPRRPGFMAGIRPLRVLPCTMLIRRPAHPVIAVLAIPIGGLAHGAPSPQSCSDCSEFATPGGFHPTPTDLDGDGIADTEEQRLLNMFAPISIGSVVYPDYGDPGGAPVSVSWMVRNGIQCRDVTQYCCYEGVGPDNITYEDCAEQLGSIPIESWIAALQVPENNSGCSWHIAYNLLRVNWLGYSSIPVERRSWAAAASNPEHTYGRAWRPWPQTHPHLVSLQYYSYYSNNDATAPFGLDIGDHHGDWGTIDITIDLEADPAQPPVLHMIFHNHGRQFFMTPEFLPSWSHRPVAYLERGSNEPWPNAGPNGTAGWPTRPGWATNTSFNEERISGCPSAFPEFCEEGNVSQHHHGEGYLIDWLAGDGVVPNVGDNGVSLCGIEGEFLQAYRGRWGRTTGTGASCPQSPLFQYKVKNRCWAETDDGYPKSGGPWQSEVTGGGPFSWSDGTLWSIEPWTLPVQSDEVYVDDLPFVGRYNGTGTPSNPYADFGLGIAMVLPHGSLRLVRTDAVGPFSAPMHLTKPLTLEAVNGPVTLGGQP
jgi:hypothetical protein